MSPAPRCQRCGHRDRPDCPSPSCPLRMPPPPTYRHVGTFRIPPKTDVIKDRPMPIPSDTEDRKAAAKALQAKLWQELHRLMEFGGYRCLENPLGAPMTDEQRLRSVEDLCARIRRAKAWESGETTMPAPETGRATPGYGSTCGSTWAGGVYTPAEAVIMNVLQGSPLPVSIDAMIDRMRRETAIPTHSLRAALYALEQRGVIVSYSGSVVRKLG